jgi:DNA-binding response OmpR family regulator
MTKPKILIVEDDFDTQIFLRLFLSKHFEVDICRSDEGFYAKIKEIKFDLVIMDIGIKGDKDGLYLTRELKSSSKYKSIPILCLSAHVMQKDKKNAYDAGVDAFLEKPVQNQTLLKNIWKLLETEK